MCVSSAEFAQRIVSERIEASIPGSVGVEGNYGNRFWHGSLERSSGRTATLIVEQTVERSVRRDSGRNRRDLKLGAELRLSSLLACSSCLTV